MVINAATVFLFSDGNNYYFVTCDAFKKGKLLLTYVESVFYSSALDFWHTVQMVDQGQDLLYPWRGSQRHLVVTADSSLVQTSWTRTRINNKMCAWNWSAQIDVKTDRQIQLDRIFSIHNFLPFKLTLLLELILMLQKMFFFLKLEEFF